jgi:hypothetical protein
MVDCIYDALEAKGFPEFGVSISAGQLDQLVQLSQVLGVGSVIDPHITLPTDFLFHSKSYLLTIELSMTVKVPASMLVVAAFNTTVRVSQVKCMRLVIVIVSVT